MTSTEVAERARDIRATDLPVLVDIDTDLVVSKCGENKPVECGSEVAAVQIEDQQLQKNVDI